ncbi:MAG: histidine--tRNA ligase, partial [Armatimonadota bacterium]
MKHQAPRGTEDLFPAEAHAWRTIESRYFELARRYGYGEVRTPMFEDAALFDRTAGEFSDIVQKEMYVFRDRGDRLLALKPEGTAPIVRAVIEGGKLQSGGHLRLAYR